jgi:hypothetical protein
LWLQLRLHAAPFDASLNIAFDGDTSTVEFIAHDA